MSTVALELVGAPSALADRAAGLVADHLRGAVAERGTATVAFSGGHTPAAMLSALTAHDLPWRHIHVFQADERVVANSHLERNLAMLRSRLLAHVPVPASHVHPMPVADADLEAATSRYAAVALGAGRSRGGRAGDGAAGRAALGRAAALAASV